MSKLVPTDDLAALAEGSYEQFVVSVGALVAEQVERIFGVQAAVETVATFPDHVIVASEDGRFAKVDFAKSDEGDLKVVGVAPVELRTFDEDHVAEFVQTEATNIVDRLFAGDAEEAKSRLLALAPLVTRSALPVKAEERSWRRTFTDRCDLILPVVGETIEDLQAKRLTPKFGKIVNGTIPTEQHEGYRELVRADLGSLDKRLADLKQAIEKATASVATVECEDEEEAKLVDLFKGFSKDLLSDLADTARKVGIAVEAKEEVASLAAVYDRIAGDLFNQEVAGQFVVQLAAKLCESNEE